MGDDLSNRPARVVDSNHNGIIDIGDMVLPEGRWVLPDDWPNLAGHDPNTTDTQWMRLRGHWDIMDQPGDEIMSIGDGERIWVLNPDTGQFEWLIIDQADKAEELGPYFPWVTNPVTGISMIAGPIRAEDPVIGPYSSLDTYTAFVYWPKLDRKTIVRNAKLNWWDCPMPPAKIIFEITEGNGFFKEVDKGDVYYHLEDLTLDTP